MRMTTVNRSISAAANFVDLFVSDLTSGSNIMWKENARHHLSFKFRRPALPKSEILLHLSTYGHLCLTIDSAQESCSSAPYARSNTDMPFQRSSKPRGRRMLASGFN